MAYTLEQFCADTRTIIKGSPRVEAGLPQVAEKLKQLLVNPAFVAETFQEETPPGKRVLYHDPETDVYVMAHVQEAGKGGSPHSHGASWAIYGNCRGDTNMTEWRRVNSESEDHAVLEVADKYTLGPGQSRAYGPGVIHSTAHPQKAWVIRLTGGDLDHLPRYHFRPKTDKILERA
jgi:predicted metal-dependent enzyme (double-stranded beta helix superfamily)